ncbi:MULTISPECIES: sigma-70 family RNA polymerase sigma factor [unclassified Afipia]|uniref:RNA polymerase sigma factor n=1 Tax=unclassified Afipia TaxID=2642050 RepID=UPI0009DF0523|nr:MULTISPECIES: sigma-70 family RNA polymerase sigma factor [unclassified Afipia]
MAASSIPRPNGRALQNEERLSRLMRATQNGDAIAYEKFLREVAPWIRNLAKRYGQSIDSSEIEDLVQDVLLSIHSARATFDPTRALMPWIWVIFRNRLSDRIRQYIRRAAHEIQTEHFPPDVFPDIFIDVTHGSVFCCQHSRKLIEAISSLPRRQREAVELVGLRDLSPAEASAIAGVSAVSLRVSLHRGGLQVSAASSQSDHVHCKMSGDSAYLSRF